MVTDQIRIQNIIDCDRRPSFENSSSPLSNDMFCAHPTSNINSCVVATVSAAYEDSHCRIDVNTAKNANVHRDYGPVGLTYDVLRSCPLYDTTSILIILMQLSPVALSSIYMLFTILTFVPPVSTSSGLSITEIFEGTMGTPAVTTVACMDIGVLLVWLFLWGPLQQFILDFAQIVIALTLGGNVGNNGSRQNSTMNIVVCLGVVFFSNFGYIPNIITIARIGELLSAERAPSSSAFQPTTKLFSHRGVGISWLRNVFAIHILTQGIIRYVRDWYLRRERRDSTNHVVANFEFGKDLSPDTSTNNWFSMTNVVTGGNGSFNNGDSSITTKVNDMNGSNTIGNSDDNNGYRVTPGSRVSSINIMNPTGPSPGTTLAEETLHSASRCTAIVPSASANFAEYATASTSSSMSGISYTLSTISSGISSTSGHISSKKKRKQSALVRLRQPLWAALASTKIVMVKEYELSQAASESAGAEATDIDNLGNAPFFSQPYQIWICYVGHDEVCFSTSTFPDDHFSESKYQLPSSCYVDITKPFFVRINNATWQPTRILALSNFNIDETDTTKSSGRRWTGDIYGLTPLSSYECEFVSTRTGMVLFSTNVRTTSTPSRSTDVAIVKSQSPSEHQLHKSPATTINASVASQDAKLSDEKARLKTLRKDNNRRINTIRKDIDRLASAVQSAGGNDEKLKQKIIQNTIHQKQAEQAIIDLEVELRDVCVIPNHLMSRHRSMKGRWDREKDLFDGAVASLKSFKNAIDNEIRSLEEEYGSLLAKKTKIASRIAKAYSDHTRITNANAQGLDEVERRNQERTSIEKDIQQARCNYDERIAAMQIGNEEKVHTINSMYEVLQSFYSSFDSERPYEDVHPVSTNTSVCAGSNSWPLNQPLASSYALRLWPAVPTSIQSLGHPSIASVSCTHTSQLTGGIFKHLTKTRGRSSSMLSNVSGFTQSSLADDDGIVVADTSGSILGVTC